jgi:hypothetical protein
MTVHVVYHTGDMGSGFQVKPHVLKVFSAEKSVEEVREWAEAVYPSTTQNVLVKSMHVENDFSDTAKSLMEKIPAK